jgi:hypothetical protein
MLVPAGLLAAQPDEFFRGEPRRRSGVADAGGPAGLSAASFAQAIQYAQNGQLQQDMGAYYPSSAYFATLSQFESLGCPPNLSGLPFG